MIIECLKLIMKIKDLIHFMKLIINHKRLIILEFQDNLNLVMKLSQKQ